MVVRSLTVAALLGTAACSTVRPVLNAREFIPAQRPDRVWVVNSKNESFVLTAPRVEGENIVGTLQGSGTQMIIPLGSTQLVEARQRDKGKTLAVGVIMGAVAGGVLFLVANAGSSEPDPQNYDNGGMQ
jgi:hypothetical protein